MQRVKALGRDLKVVFISHSDPDYYFGLDVIKQAFPNAKVVSTAQTAYLIAASQHEKLVVWKDQLGADAPTALLVPEAMSGDAILIDGQPVQLRTQRNDSAHSYLWIPSLKTVLGGISVASGAHLWMADTRNAAEIDQWVAQIDDMKSLQPSAVIPGHGVNAGTSPAMLDFVRGYLANYKAAAAASPNAAGIVQTMTAKYPTLPGKDSLDMGAKVFKGEMPWHVWSPFAPIGRTLKVDFGTTPVELKFLDNRRMTFGGATDADKEVPRALNYTAVEVSPNVFMVQWQAPHSTGAPVVQVHNYGTQQAYTNIANKDGSVVNLRGKLALD